MLGQVQLVPVVRPRAKLEWTALGVEWIVGDVDATGALDDDRHLPRDVAIGLHSGHRVT